MKKVYLILFVALLSIGWITYYKAEGSPATDFLNTLNENQKEKCIYPFTHQAREFWSFLPGAVIPRPGLKLSDLSKEQRTSLFKLLAFSLSDAGYNKVMQIIDLENVLVDLGQDKEFRNADNYFVSFYGTPEEDDLWSWSFEGHHIAMKFTITPSGTAVVPRFLGANPATIPSGPRKGERTLKEEEDYAIELIQSMTEEQKEKAIIRKEPFFDIVTQNSLEVSPLKEVGISVSEMTAQQTEILDKLIDVYLSSLPLELAKNRLSQIRNDEFENITFGWAGSTNIKEGHYYRIQGSSFLVEFDNWMNNANHIHTVWREFDGDYGRDLILEHYMQTEHPRME